MSLASLRYLPRDSLRARQGRRIVLGQWARPGSRRDGLGVVLNARDRLGGRVRSGIRPDDVVDWARRVLALRAYEFRRTTSPPLKVDFP